MKRIQESSACPVLHNSMFGAGCILYCAMTLLPHTTYCNTTDKLQYPSDRNNKSAFQFEFSNSTGAPCRFWLSVPESRRTPISATKESSSSQNLKYCCRQHLPASLLTNRKCLGCPIGSNGRPTTTAVDSRQQTTRRGACIAPIDSGVITTLNLISWATPSSLPPASAQNRNE